MYHSIRHQTKFRYNEPVRETIMEVRLQPRTEWTQHLLSFDLQVSPRARVLQYKDHLGNTYTTSASRDRWRRCRL